jgi:hypothetical protein
MTVWVDNWQLQCCGEPFTIGSTVSWTLREADTDWLTAVLGAETAASVDAAEEHHDNMTASTPPTSAKVVRIDAVHCRYNPPEGHDRTRYPAEGSGTLTVVTSADGWTPDRGELKFVGYLVRLATA